MGGRGIWFQSHAGSIEAQHSDIKQHREEVFQSHAGSIEARTAPIIPSALARGFNPTLVRLRPSHDPIPCSDLRIVSIPRWFD